MYFTNLRYTFTTFPTCCTVGVPLSPPGGATYDMCKVQYHSQDKLKLFTKKIIFIGLIYLWWPPTLPLTETVRKGSIYWAASYSTFDRDCEEGVDILGSLLLYL